MILALLTIYLCCLTFIYGANYVPEQIQLSFTGDTKKAIHYGLQVTYTTGSSTDSTSLYKSAPKSNIWYGTSPSSLNLHDTGKTKHFSHKLYSSDIHNIILTHLEANTIYYYRVGDDTISGGVSAIYSFSTGVARSYAIFGDYGYDGLERSIDGLTTLVKNDTFHGIFHIGDIGYDLHKKSGSIGDAFLRQIEPLTTKVPYLVTPGNHESSGNFTHYLHRFQSIHTLGQNSQGSPLWYSLNQHLVHFIVFDSEVYDPYPDPIQQAAQLQWLESDLKKYNSPELRAEYPWIITLSHKCDWQTDTDFSGFRPLLQKYGVDLHFCGHQHNYQRLYPGYAGTTMESTQGKYLYKNPSKYTQIVIGSPGCKSHIGHHLCPYDNGLANYALAYGFGLLNIVNSTHIMFNWVKTHEGKKKDGEDSVAQELLENPEQLITPTTKYLQEHYPRVLLNTTITSDEIIASDISDILTKKNKKNKSSKKNTFQFQVADHLTLIQENHAMRTSSITTNELSEIQAIDESQAHIDKIHSLSEADKTLLSLYHHSEVQNDEPTLNDKLQLDLIFA